jgi:squalene-hopene/tetraprenyl-beta-curcumene cyclase
VTSGDDDRAAQAVHRLARQLLDRRAAPDHWEGRLASSALSTATAVLALYTAQQHGYSAAGRLDALVSAGSAWLLAHQNSDGGWGDTDRSRSNISTTVIVWATMSQAGRTRLAESLLAAALGRAEAWLRQTAGDVAPDALRNAILERYGDDRTFSVPILMVMALTNKLGNAEDAWRSIPQLPFELAAFPHRWFQHLRLPVVSYALPALIAIGQVRHHFASSPNPAVRALRQAVRDRTHRLLRDMQPESGGYLEATPLTSFVVMALAAMDRTDSPVVEHGVRFLIQSMREDGSWPIDTNLATWITTLSVDALGKAGALPAGDIRRVRAWLLAQQSRQEHPFTHAAPGAWAWTPLSGGVPDADDTCGALLALRRLGDPDRCTRDAAAAGVKWLLDVQNRDGGLPTFCRGWGSLPFDRSTPEITAHALRAWTAWQPHLPEDIERAVIAASARAVEFLCRTQHQDGSWLPLWFGNEHAAKEGNPVYGTSRVVQGLSARLVRTDGRVARCRRLGAAWLIEAQNADGGWGGARGVVSSIEETGIALAALRVSGEQGVARRVPEAITRGSEWLVEATGHSAIAPAPIGLYFAKLWYYDELYPLIFALAGLTPEGVLEES